MNDLVLEGCRPIPLASYLKALGILRLVAEQADPQARGWWQDDRFRLRTNLDRGSLARFFLHDYHPTPIIAPWNGGSGFYPKDAKAGISALQESRLERLAACREAIELGTRMVRDRKLDERPTDLAKSELISALRAEAGAALVGWIDAAIALTLDRLAFPPLLGTGGNDGRLDFTNNFMQRLTELIPVDGGEIPAATIATLDDALFATPVAGLASAAIGQFAPGAAGGPNSAAGFQGDALVNRWDFVLMLEGSLVFAGGVSRRLEGADAAYLSYPFTVRAAAAGYGSASLEEQGESRGELWAPLWERPARYDEVRSLFREGRLSLGTRPVRDGLDAARAIGGLGVDRGIASFERYGFVKRQGLAFLAAPLGRQRVEPNPRGELLGDLDRRTWLERLRSRATSDEAAADLRESVRALDDGIFALLQRPEDARCVQEVLIAVGAAARAIALRPKLQESLRPPLPLADRWIEAADDESAEFRMALALAGLRVRWTDSESDGTEAPDDGERSRREKSGLPMRAHLAPLDPDTVRHAPAWASKQLRAAEGRALAVWGAGRLTDNLCAVAQRRLLEQTRRAWSGVSLFDASVDRRLQPVAVSSGEIAAFLGGEVRDERIARLLLGLAWVQPARFRGELRSGPLPFVYAALKPLFTPYRGLPPLPMPPALPSLLAAGRIQEAIRLAQERARASGLPTPFLSRRPAADRRPDPGFGRRLLAALIIPVRMGVVRDCLEQAYPYSDPHSEEESPYAA
ncbi:MAG: type I-U CRISPR-associated protein Csx17 [Burkholderiales bacterium]|nr:type I-U CRISPR-associated protein Csx17 [Burkholderiales bacterium]OJX07738.1 MAG: type I-U CRISPR-associated protein Csx17 [Burkholderiales bacterium 70-64]